VGDKGSEEFKAANEQSRWRVALSNDRCLIVLLLLFVAANFISLTFSGFSSPAIFFYDESLLVWSAAGLAHTVWGLGATKGQLAIFAPNYAATIFSLKGNPDALRIILQQTELAAHPVFMGRYPPGIGLTVYMFFSIFGVDFWTARLSTTVFHVATLLLFTYNLKRYVKSYRLAVIGGFLISTVPMSVYFGRLLEMFMPSLFFMILAVTYYTTAQVRRARWRVGPTLVCTCLSLFYHWVGLLLALLIIALELRKKDRSIRRVAIFASVVSGLLVVLVFSILVTGVIGQSFTYFPASIGQFGSMLGLLVGRTFLSTRSDTGQPITLVSWLLRFAVVNAWGYTPFVSLMAIAGFLRSVRAAGNSLTYAERVNGVLLVLSVLFTIIAAQGVYVHMYYQYFLLPGEIYYAAVFLDKIVSMKAPLSLSSIFVIMLLAVVYVSSRFILDVTTSAPASYLEKIMSSLTNY